MAFRPAPRREWRQTQLRNRLDERPWVGMHSGLSRLGGAESRTHLLTEDIVCSIYSLAMAGVARRGPAWPASSNETDLHTLVHGHGIGSEAHAVIGRYVSATALPASGRRSTSCRATKV
jgi:hypothetical protein